ncbi:MAG: hypothetical protein KME50_00530 [Nostoc desertorum CM1-VF14]|nr:hypothetical protein [Nostoc desertorum CM1-VF14]
MAKNEQRIVLTFEYVTDTRVGMLKRFVSNMKDAIAYFGFRQVFRSYSKWVKIGCSDSLAGNLV